MNATHVPSMSQGAFVFWDVKPARHNVLRSSLESLGIGDYCPPPLSQRLSLKRALRKVGGRVERGERRNGYDQLASVHIVTDDDGVETVHLSAGVCDWRALQEAYRKNRQTVSGAAIGKLLTRCVSELHGTCIPA